MQLRKNTNATRKPSAPKEKTMTDIKRDEPKVPKIVDRRTFQAERDALRVREKAHTREEMPSQPPGGGSPWSRWMVPHPSMPNVAQ